ncbi:hypothetical protein [Listeria costaricensis]|uniref:hypothetical protein n=1 Tax=Listeria costaricensis TaxID=2026604 RepID=UPI000C06B5A1|nr:hypothetical protein [Listeria costaricensis]
MLTFHFEQGFDDYWLINVERDIVVQLTLRKEEVQAAKWVMQQQINEWIDQGKMIPYRLINLLFDLHQSNRTLYINEAQK